MEAVKPKRTLVEETYDILIDALCSGELSPGERLNQDEIAAKLNVSRQPVNSAISILKANGLVEDTGRRSVVVKSFDTRLFHSIYEYRRVIEPFAVSLISKPLTEAQLRQAERVLMAGQKAIKRGNLIALIRADMLFHEMIYTWSENLVIESSMKTIWHHIRRSMAEVLREPNAVEIVWEQHAQIIAFLKLGQTENAAQVMRLHIDNAYQKLSRALMENRSDDKGNS
ncbi:MAG: GntR family transcriptional regulator [Roseobacter sp.]